MKLCPRCRLPVLRLGRVFAAITGDSTVSGIIGVCEKCTGQEVRLPRSVIKRRYDPALDRALRNPENFYCVIYNDLGKAELAAAMLGHPDYADATLEAVGWRSEKCRGGLRDSNLTQWLRITGADGAK